MNHKELRQAIRKAPAVYAPLSWSYLGAYRISKADALRAIRSIPEGVEWSVSKRQDGGLVIHGNDAEND